MRVEALENNDREVTCTQAPDIHQKAAFYPSLRQKRGFLADEVGQYGKREYEPKFGISRQLSSPRARPPSLWAQILAESYFMFLEDE